MNKTNHNYTYPLYVKRAISLAILLLTAVSTNANAFFFFIPGFVTAKIADAVTGSEGENCVGSTAKVGDIISLPNGGTVMIKSLSGQSIRCTQPDHPIRALLDMSDSSFGSKVGINLPDGWELIALTEQQKYGGWLLMAKNPLVNGSGLSIGVSKRKDVPDMMAVVTNARLSQANKVAEPHQSEIEQITVNEMRAWRYEITGKMNGLFGSKHTYLTTIIEGDQEIVIVTVWTSADTFEKQKETLKRMAENVSGINHQISTALVSTAPVPIVPSPKMAEATPQTVPVVAVLSNQPDITPYSTSSITTAPAAATVVASIVSNALPIKSENSPSRLRALNALYKDGVINKKDFEIKKQEILKSM